MITYRIEQDSDSANPGEWLFGHIAYHSSRYALGTDCVSRDRLDEIKAGVDSGKLIGMPVYAYVHSGATISTSSFSCPWDSGQSGYVYCTREEAIAELGKKSLTKRTKEQALELLEDTVKVFDMYLQGDIWGYVIEDDGKELGSCWGFYGYESCKKEAEMEMLIYNSRAAVERTEKSYWEERDVQTETENQHRVRFRFTI